MGVVYKAQKGDMAAARKAYQDFFALWKNADAEIKLLAQTKQEYGRLAAVANRD